MQTTPNAKNALPCDQHVKATGTQARVEMIKAPREVYHGKGDIPVLQTYAMSKGYGGRGKTQNNSAWTPRTWPPAETPIKVDPSTVQIFRLPAMVNPGVYSKPIPFGGMGKPVNQIGFSDHFPITIRVTEVD